ncbi:hypothetical protein [Patulibacter medicamentivorans]|uniref:hypothetical protein n=1 Tax=Patulibacter medicamentivorans TaxID=1097667 RepID=UPI001110BB84|nr:hypothetical protein [Patulibacter medicamentivorans]
MSTPDTGRLIFTPRPAPVSPRLRPAHRVALLLEMIDKCHGAKATLLQLHAIDTALADPDARRRLAGDDSRDVALSAVRVDPALNRAVDRAIGEGLLSMNTNATVELTPAGRNALEAVRGADILRAERAALAEIPGKITRGKARAAAGARP